MVSWEKSLLPVLGFLALDEFWWGFPDSGGSAFFRAFSSAFVAGVADSEPQDFHGRVNASGIGPSVLVVLRN